MNRLLDRPLGVHVKRVLRTAEAKIFPHAAGERSMYETQERMLHDPQTREAYVLQLREKVAQLVPGEYLPAQSLFLQYQTRPDMFASDRQAYYSDHNIAHHAIVMVGSLLGSRYMQARDPHVQINEQAILIASSLHDTQRKNDQWESVPPFLEKHAVLVSRRAMGLIAEMGANPDMQTVLLTKQMLRYHDVDRKQLGDKYTTELGIMVAADRAALGRLFTSPDDAIRLTAGNITARRMRTFKNGGIAADPAVFAKLSEILGALDIMTKEKIAHGDPQLQFHYVLESARELGILSNETQKNSAA